MKYIVMFPLVFFMGIISCIAQEKVVFTEKDGFQWNLIVSTNKKYGAQTLEGKDIIPLSANYDMVFMYDGLFCGEKVGTKTLFTKSGKKILGPAKSLVWMYIPQDNCYDYSVGDYHGCLDQYGNIIISADDKYTSLFYHKDNKVIYVKKDGYSGVCNLKGKILIPTSRKYESVYYVKSDDGVEYFGFEKNGMTGACDINGNEVLKPEVIGKRIGNIDYNKLDGFFYTENSNVIKLNVKMSNNMASSVGNMNVANNVNQAGSKTNQKASRTANNSTNTQNSKAPFAGYTQIAGKVPGIGEKRYWNKSGTISYCSVECYNANGTVLYNIWPDPIDYQHPGARYLYQTQRNGWYVFSRVNIRVYSNFNTFKVETSYDPIPGEFMISTDGNTVVSRDGTRFDTPITKETANLLAKKQNDFIARGVGSGVITLDNQPSETVQQIQDEIDAIDRKQSQRIQKELKDATTREETYRGHGTIRYNSTNTESTKTVWCSVCKRYDKPHKHVLNDGRH